MKRLYVLRHAKSSWATPGLQDIDRRLNARGVAQSRLLNTWLCDQSNLPDIVLCSPSQRTIETYQNISVSVERARFNVVDKFYHGSPDTYLEMIWSVDDTTNSLMIIGHNPTCDELSRYIAKPSSPDFDKLMAHHFGTANLAVFDIDSSSWSAVSQGSASVVKMVRPKDIERAG